MGGTANVYIDGFNLYYGALKDNPSCKWLDLESYFATLLPPGLELNRVRYFTAPVKPTAMDRDQPSRQASYLQAIAETQPKTSVHKGQFQRNKSKLPLASDPTKLVRVVKMEEKGSDVNLASYLLFDAFENEAECALVVTDDFDQIEPLRMAREELGRTIGIVSPRRRPKLSRTVGAAFYRPVYTSDLAGNQLPDTVQGLRGPIHRPRSWA